VFQKKNFVISFEKAGKSQQIAIIYSYLWSWLSPPTVMVIFP